MGFGIDLRARSRKGQGLFRRAPDPREIAERLGRLLPRVFKGWDRKTSQIAVHPAAPPVDVALDGAELIVRGETWQVGPGYHADVLARFAPLLDELDLVWDAPALPQIAGCDVCLARRRAARWAHALHRAPLRIDTMRRC